MPKCEIIRKKHRKSSIGDMVDRIIIHNRSITAPGQGGVDFSESFTPESTVWANINTVSGETLFDGTNTERDVTHKIVVRWIPDLTSENWIELQSGELLDILPTENLDMRSEFILLKCSNRGTKSNLANEL